MFRHPQIQCFETCCSMSNSTTDSPSCWNTVMVSCIDLIVSKPFQCTEMSLSCQGLTPQHSFPSLGCCRRSFLSHQGFGSREGSNKQCALPFAVMDQMPSLDHWLQASLQKHLLLVAVLQFCSEAPPLFTHCSNFCCMLLINFSVVVKTINGSEKK